MLYFYPRSPCGERPWQRGSRITYVEFLSTLSLRRATTFPGFLIGCIDNFYPRSPCGERRFCPTCQWRRSVISIHALLAESDRVDGHLESVKPSFLSTLSLRRATHPKMSNHPHNTNFYPRSPCGERLGRCPCWA